jgi:hypothetical protein
MTVYLQRFFILNALNFFDIIVTFLMFAMIPSWPTLEGNPVMRALPVDVATAIKILLWGSVALVVSHDSTLFRIGAAFMSATVTWNLLMWLPWIVHRAGMGMWAVFIISIPPWAWVPVGG